MSTVAEEDTEIHCRRLVGVERRSAPSNFSCDMAQMSMPKAGNMGPPYGLHLSSPLQASSNS